MLIEAPITPWQPACHRIKQATLRWELNGAQALRREVFCVEQEIFDGHDRDAIDDHAITLVALTTMAGAPDRVVGTVRIYRGEDGAWWGGRLAVARDQRGARGLGTGLIQLAVRLGNRLGCRRFLANVQAQNVPLFEKLHWASLDRLEIGGVLHHRMEADLAFYPPEVDGLTGFLSLARRAA